MGTAAAYVLTMRKEWSLGDRFDGKLSTTRSRLEVDRMHRQAVIWP